MSEVLKMRPNGKIRIVRSSTVSSSVPVHCSDLTVSVQQVTGCDDSGATGSIRSEEAAEDQGRFLRDEYERGVLEGRRQERELLKQDFDARLASAEQRIDRLVENIGEHFAVLYRQSEQAIIKFAFGVAERIIRREASKKGEMILESIKQGVTRILGVEKIKIRVHQDDLTTVRGHRDRIQANGEALREIVVEADDHLDRGDCILESDLGNIDARISTQLKQIENALFESEVVS